MIHIVRFLCYTGYPSVHSVIWNKKWYRSKHWAPWV